MKNRTAILDCRRLQSGMVGNGRKRGPSSGPQTFPCQKGVMHRNRTIHKDLPHFCGIPFPPGFVLIFAFQRSWNDPSPSALCTSSLAPSPTPLQSKFWIFFKWVPSANRTKAARTGPGKINHKSTQIGDPCCRFCLSQRCGEAEERDKRDKQDKRDNHCPCCRYLTRRKEREGRAPPDIRRVGTRALPIKR